MADSSQQMQAAAEAAVRRWPGLDGTLESVELVEGVVKGGGVSEQELQLLEAYVGELVRQHAGTGRWRVSRFSLESASGPDGVLKFKHWEFDPYEVLKTFTGPLAASIDEAITFGKTPSKRTVQALGWQTRLITDETETGVRTIREDPGFLPARLSVWWLRHREHRAQAR